MQSIPLLASALAVGLAGFAAWTTAEPEPTPTPFASVFTPDPDFQFDPPAPGSYRLNHIKTAPDGQVIDIHGKSHNLSDLTKGKISLISFVYLNCGDVNGCPIAMATLFDIHETSAKLPGLKDDVQLMTISFDPERDTVEAIEAFAYPITSSEAADKQLDWHVLTTSGMDALQPILDGYGQVIDKATEPDQISHLLRMYLVDRDGSIRNVYGLGLIDPRLLITDVETLLMQERAS